MTILNFCPKCGVKTSPGNLFCENCGEKLSAAPPENSEINQPNLNSQNKNQTLTAPQAPAFNQQTFTTQQNLPAVKKNNSLPLILIIVLLLIVVSGIGGYFAYTYLINKSSDITKDLTEKIEKEIPKHSPQEIQIEPTVKTPPKEEPVVINSEEQENTTQQESVKKNSKNNDVSDVTGDSEVDTQKYPGKYPEGSITLLNAGDLNGYSRQQLRIMRNEIFARHGYIFNSEDLRNYFEKQSWYRAENYNVDNLLSRIERSNVALIKSLEDYR